jgi:hypothetical protein
MLFYHELLLKRENVPKVPFSPLFFLARWRPEFLFPFFASNTHRKANPSLSTTPSTWPQTAGSELNQTGLSIYINNPVEFHVTVRYFARYPVKSVQFRILKQAHEVYREFSIGKRVKENNNLIMSSERNLHPSPKSRVSLSTLFLFFFPIH